MVQSLSRSTSLPQVPPASPVAIHSWGTPRSPGRSCPPAPRLVARCRGVGCGGGGGCYRWGIVALVIPPYLIHGNHSTAVNVPPRSQAAARRGTHLAGFHFIVDSSLSFAESELHYLNLPGLASYPLPVVRPQVSLLALSIPGRSFYFCLSSPGNSL